MHHMFFHPMLSQLFAGEFDAQGGSIPVHAVKAIVIDFSVKNTVFSLQHLCHRRRQVSVHSCLEALFDGLDISVHKDSDSAVR